MSSELRDRLDMKLSCKYCGRYLMDVRGTTIVEGLICTNSKCKAKLNVKVITPSSSEVERKYKFTKDEMPPRDGWRQHITCDHNQVQS